jgi:hypothetical protein
MAYKDNQTDPALPADNLPRRETVNHLPKYFRTDFNKKFLNATLDQMVQPGVVEKINGFYGKKNAKAFDANDNYINDITPDRQNYQLEPITISKDNLNNINFFADYNDYINFIKIRHGNLDHSVLNSQEYYSWNPHINWDKFINFREYYWLPNGPETITISGQSKEVVSEYTVSLRDNDDNFTYIFTPDGLTNNPSLTLYRGQTYRFDVNTPNYPIAFVSRITFTPGEEIDAEYNSSLIYTNGIKKIDRDGLEITADFVDDGIIEFVVPEVAPDNLFYISKDDPNLSGIIKIFDVVENTEINVDKEILGKKSYLTSGGFHLSNGMKIEFAGNVFPEEFSTGEYYVEGVGEKIELIDTNRLKLSSLFVDDLEIPFDDNGFDQYPYSEALGYAVSKDYITINRSSIDGNLWSKYNRWFHIDVIEQSLKINNQAIEINQNLRAKRPIIEFEKNLKLFEFGTVAKNDVWLVDDVTTDVFSTIEGSIGYNIDGVDLTEGIRILFLADNDILVKGKIFKVKFITVNNNTQITLIEEPDTNPIENENVLVREGKTYKSKSLYYDGNEWKICQQKNNVNQAPLFDMYDYNGVAFTDSNVYPFSQFSGNKIFSYKESSNTIDVELGFGLSYRNIVNSGDIIFEFNLLQDSFPFTNNNNLVTEVKTDIGFLRKYSSLTDYVSVNGWSTASTKTQQVVIRQYVVEDVTNLFEIDVYDNYIDDKELWLRVYVNGNIKELDKDYFLERNVNDDLFINFVIPIKLKDNIIIKTKYKSIKNDNGYYELPYSLERNPLNENVTDFTLGEVIDHGSTIVEESTSFRGKFPGKSNLRDLGNLSIYGRKFLKHTCPLNLSIYHLLDKDVNVLAAIDNANDLYGKFKRQFVEIANDLGYNGPIKEHVDLILDEYTKGKNNKDPYFFSDMAASKGVIVYKEIIVDTDQRYFQLSKIHNNNMLGNKAVSVYRNGKQLIYGQDYTFNTEGFVDFFGFKKVDDIIEICEYDNTNGSYIPPTPTKLGLYPKYIPEIFIDNTNNSFITEENKGPYKFYGLQKNEPNDEDILGWFYPLYLDYDLACISDENNECVIITFAGLNRVFYMPKSDQNKGAQDSIYFDEWNEGNVYIQGHDGSLVYAYKDFRDELILEIEKRIYNNIKINYDTNLFDINEIIPGRYRNTNITRSSLNDPLISDFIKWTRFINVEYAMHQYFDVNNSFTYNYNGSKLDNYEVSPGWWRQIYTYLFDTDRPHTHPWEMLGFSIKPIWWDDQYGSYPYTSDNLLMWSDIEKGIIRQPNFFINKKYTRPGLTKIIPVDNKGNLVSPSKSGVIKYYDKKLVKKSFVFGDGSPVETVWRRSSNYRFSLIKSLILCKPSYVFGTGFDRANQVRNDSEQIIYLPTQNHFRLQDLVFPYVENENFYTSGLINYIAENQNTLFFNNYENYRNILVSLNNQISFKVGGFTDKDKFKLILDSRTPLNEGNVFIPLENYDILFLKSYPIDEYVYSGVVIEKQAEGWYISGYDTAYSKFKYIPIIPRDADTTINVGGISKSYVTWEAGKTYAIDAIVKVGDDSFYRCKITHVSGDNFDNSKFVTLPRLPIVGGVDAKTRRYFSQNVEELSYGTLLYDIQEVVDFLYGYGHYLKTVGFTFDRFVESQLEVADWSYAVKQFLFWTTQNWGAGSLITVSPGADRLNFSTNYGSVGNVIDTSQGYSIYKADGTVIKTSEVNFNRDNDNNFSVTTTGNDGIYFIRIPTNYAEHVVIIDDRTEFNDIIYEKNSGYRQERIKVIGYRTNAWKGSLDIPGFFYDDAKVKEWQQYVAYNVGDIVKYKEFYFVAKNKIDAVENFDFTDWKKLDTLKEAGLYTNFDYRIEQFKDFYDLDSDNLDVEQQKMAQHLIGYQKRNYLQNIINNDVSQFKFYQGFIQDKGSKNSLTKLFDVLASADKDSLEFYEEWAIRQGVYGAVDNFYEFDFKLNESKFRLTPQPVEINVNNKDNIDLIYRINPTEAYFSDGNSSSPFPSFNNTKTYVKHAGYVSPSDVDYTLADYTDLLKVNLNDIKVNEYFWIGNDPNGWNIYQYKNYNKFIKFEVIGTDNLALEFEFDIEDDFQIGQIVGVSNVEKITFVGQDSTVIANDYVSSFSGVFQITDIQINKIICALTDLALLVQINTDSLQGDTTGIVSIFSSVRVSNLQGLEQLVLKDYQLNKKIWVDEDADKNWSVYQINHEFKLSTSVTNPAKNITSFGNKISINDRNTVLAIADPLQNDGIVYVYTRPSINQNWKLFQILSPEEPDSESFNIGDSEENAGIIFVITNNSVENINLVYKNGEKINEANYSINVENNQVIMTSAILADDTITISFLKHIIPYKFGASLDVENNSNHIIVGAPDASYLKTRIKGTFDPTMNYSSGDIVNYEVQDIGVKNYYRALVDILPESSAQEFNAFFNYSKWLYDNNLYFENSYSFPLLFTGTYNEREETTDHLIIRIPSTVYNGIKVDDQIVLHWNTLTNANQTQLELVERQPFDGLYSQIDNVFLNNKHTILYKFSKIIKVANSAISLSKGQQISSTTANAEIEQAISIGNSNDFIIYLKNIQGSLLQVDSIKVGIQIVGNYELIAPLEEESIVQDEFAGFIAISTPAYTTTYNRTDSGRGLIIRELITEKSPDQNLIYSNILEYDNASLIRILSYEDYNLNNLGEYNPITKNLRYFLIRASKTLTDTYVDDSINFYFNQLPKTVSVLKVRNTRFTTKPVVVKGETLRQKNNSLATVTIFSDTVEIDPATINFSNPVYLIQVQNVSETSFNFIDDLVGSESGELFCRPIEEPVVPKLDTLEEIGLNTNLLINNNLDIWNTWDGYIIYQENRTDSNGLPYVPYAKYIEDGINLTSFDGNNPNERVGQTIREINESGNPTNNTAEVMYVQRIGNNRLILFVNNVQGNWRLGQDQDQPAQLQMDAHPTGQDIFSRLNIFNFDREFGVSVNVILPSEDVGKFFVIDYGSEIQAIFDQVTAQPKNILINQEYWFFNNESIQGLPRLAAYPNNNSVVWERIYSLSIDDTGTASTYEKEGVVFVYKKIGAKYQLVKRLLGPDRQNNYKWGSNLKIGNFQNVSKTFILADNPKRLYFVKDGNDNGIVYNWDYATNKKYKGVYNENETYFTGDIVFVPRNVTENVFSSDIGIFDGTLFESLTNGSVNVLKNNSYEINTDYWKLADELIDYVGFVPNNSGNVQLDSTDISTLSVDGLIKFGLNFDISDNAEVLAVLIKYDNTNKNKISIFRNDQGYYRFSQIIEADTPEIEFGYSFALSSDGNTLAIGAPLFDTKRINVGKVYVYKLENTKFVLKQELSSPNNEIEEMFGITVDINDNLIAVGSANADIKVETTYDSNDTIFDNGLTTFKYTKSDKGAIFVYDDINGHYVYGNKIIYDNPYANSYDLGENFVLKNKFLYVSDPNYTNENGTIGYVLNYSNIENKLYDNISRQKQTVDLSKVKKIFLYNTKTKEIIKYLDYVDVLQGKLPGPAEQNISYKLYYDPAIYSTGGSSVVVDPTTAWTTENVGKIWWDLSTVKYYYPYINDISFSTNFWNKQFLNTNVDLYEWVESPLLPLDWNELSETNEGYSLGITGRAKYTDSYTEKSIYNNVTDRIEKKYYFWVKDAKNIPDLDNRTISAYKLQTLMKDPLNEGYEFVSLISDNEFAIYNCEKFLNDKDVAISFQIYKDTDQRINTHFHYDIITEDIETNKIKENLSVKWIDSLVGYDLYGRSIPDISIGEKYRYGNLTEPRQSWFVNRQQALKEYVQRINRVLKENLIVDSKNLKNLYLKDEYPLESSNQYDLIVDNLDALNLYGIAKAEQASIDITVENGKVVSARIINPGRGYIKTPTFTVIGQGSNLELNFTLNAIGSIVNVDIVNAGENYNNNASVEIRKFTALVLNDETINGKWALYERNYTANSWNRVRSQGYDTRAYWKFIDWYSTGYDSTTPINFIIDFSYQLNSINDTIGNIVKINTIGSGGWLLLKKVDNQDNVDYSINYETIGRENGTIEFLNTLYDPYAAYYNFDLKSFDISFYDDLPTTEVRIIANAIKDDIFVDDLAIEYNRLFFAAIRYVLSEQGYVDWLFKTSFIRVKHNVGNLRKDVTFNNDNLPSYEDYVNEVKPYKTKIREYISSYEKIDNNPLLTADFDLAPAYVDRDKRILPQQIKVFGDVLYGVSDEHMTYPNKNWLDNCYYVVTDIKISYSGYGYKTVPTVRFEGGGGSGVKAVAFLGENGSIVNIEVIDEGSGYLQAPQIYIDGETYNDFAPARVSVILGKPLVRSTLTKIKFDRIAKTIFYSNIDESYTEITSGSKYIFDLYWPMSLLPKDVNVYVNGEKLLFSRYKYENVLDNTKSYTRYLGRVTLVDVPSNYSEVKIEYKKDINLLPALDRLNYYYSPIENQFGNTPNQLLDGIDYGGVEVKSFGFGNTTGWDSHAFFVNQYDTYDTTFEDHVNTVGKNLLYNSNIGYKIQINWTNFAKAVNALVKGDSVEIDNHTLFYSIFNVNQLGEPVTDPLDGTSILNVLDELVSELVLDQNGNVVLDENGDASYQLTPRITIRSVEQILLYGLNSVDLEELAIYNIETQIIPIISTLTGSQVENLINETNSVLNDVKLIFKTPLEENVQYNVYYNGLRIDDINFVTDPTNITNPNATLATIIGDGLQQELILRDIVSDYQTDDVVILRKPTSDGSFLPTDLDYDTLLVGGNLDYTNAKGIESADIVVDGDNFVTHTTSKGPEENVPGLVQDTLDIKVYERPIVGSSNIFSMNYITDGINNTYNIGNYPLSARNLIVKIDKEIVTNYSVNSNKTITFNTLLPAGKRVNITTLDYSGFDVLDVDTIECILSTNIFVVNARWEENLQSEVSVNGKEIDYVIVPSNTEFSDSSNNILIKFGKNINVGDVVRYVIYSNKEGQEKQKFSTTYIDNFIADGSTNIFELTKLPELQQPAEWYTMVLVNNKLLNPGYTETFILTDSREYNLKLHQVPLRTVSFYQLRVFLNERELKHTDEWTYSAAESFDPLIPDDQQVGSIVYLVEGIGNIGDTLRIYINAWEDSVESGGDYRYGYYENGEFTGTPGVLHINKPLNEGDLIKVYQFSNHDSQRIDWQSFDMVERTKLSPGNIDQSYTNIVTDLNQIYVAFTLQSDKFYAIYRNGFRVDDQFYGTTTQGNQAAEIQTPIGNGTNYLNFNEIGLNVLAGDIVKVEEINAQINIDQDSQNYYEFKQLRNGLIPLNYPAVTDSYVFVAVNGKMLHASIDYYVTTDKMHVKLAQPLLEDDVVQTIHFSNPQQTKKFAWRQFTDILNRNHYSIIDGQKNVRLRQDLHWYDKVIVVDNEEALPAPTLESKYPGVIFINGERIEYRARHGNILQHLRRGTLGTGVKDIYYSGTEIYDQSIDKLLPYKDETIVVNIVADGNSNEFTLDFVANSVNEFEVFVGGVRLRKTPLESYELDTVNRINYGTNNEHISQDSPEGDVTLPPEFVLEKNILRLTKIDEVGNNVYPSAGTVITIIRKIGKIWTEAGQKLVDSESPISRMIRSVEADLPR